MNDTLFRILKSREDISDYLFHFTSGSKAFETLIKIKDDSELKDVKGNGFICFSESPILLLKDMFKIFEEYPEPMYAPYGVAIKKDLLYSSGARHVIYGPLEERRYIDDSIKWRYEVFNPIIKDFTWLREWRLPESDFQLNSENCFFITKTKNESEQIGFNENDIKDIEVEAEPADGGFEFFYSAIIRREFKCISIEEIEQINKMTKSELDEILYQQNIDDTTEMYLGSN